MPAISYASNDFNFPGRLKGGQMAQKYSRLANVDLMDQNDDELLWECVRNVLLIRITPLVLFLNQPSSDIAWQISDIPSIASEFGDLYFAMSILRKSVTNAIEEDDDPSENDDEARQQVERMGDACGRVMEQLAIGFGNDDRNLDYDTWRLETSRCIMDAVVMIGDISKKLYEHEEEMNKILEDMGTTLNVAVCCIQRWVEENSNANH